MAIEHHPWGDVYTGDDVHVYRILTLRMGLRLELRGIRIRRPSIHTLVKREFGLRGNRQSVYDQFCRMHNLEP